MQTEIIKKDSKQNIVGNAKAIKDMGHTFENVLDTNEKNTKELYAVMKKELETNETISQECRKLAERSVAAYESAMKESTSEEDRKMYCDKIEKITLEALKKQEEVLENNKNIVAEAIKVDEENKKLSWKTIATFGVCSLAALGVVTFVGPKGTEVLKKLVDKKNN